MPAVMAAEQSGTKPNFAAKIWLPNLVLYQTTERDCEKVFTDGGGPEVEYIDTEFGPPFLACISYLITKAT